MNNSKPDVTIKPTTSVLTSIIPKEHVPIHIILISCILIFYAIKLYLAIQLDPIYKERKRWWHNYGGKEYNDYFDIIYTSEIFKNKTLFIVKWGYKIFNRSGPLRDMGVDDDDKPDVYQWISEKLLNHMYVCSNTDIEVDESIKQYQPGKQCNYWVSNNRPFPSLARNENPFEGANIAAIDVATGREKRDSVEEPNINSHRFKTAFPDNELVQKAKFNCCHGRSKKLNASNPNCADDKRWHVQGYKTGACTVLPTSDCVRQVCPPGFSPCNETGPAGTPATSLPLPGGAADKCCYNYYDSYPKLFTNREDRLCYLNKASPLSFLTPKHLCQSLELDASDYLWHHRNLFNNHCYERPWSQSAAHENLQDPNKGWKWEADHMFWQEKISCWLGATSNIFEPFLARTCAASLPQGGGVKIPYGASQLLCPGNPANTNKATLQMDFNYQQLFNWNNYEKYPDNPFSRLGYDPYNIILISLANSDQSACVGTAESCRQKLLIDATQTLVGFSNSASDPIQPGHGGLIGFGKKVNHVGASSGSFEDNERPLNILAPSVTEAIIAMRSEAAAAQLSNIKDMRCPDTTGDNAATAMTGLMALGTAAELGSMGAAVGGPWGAAAGAAVGLGIGVWAWLSGEEEKDNKAEQANIAARQAASNLNPAITAPGGVPFTSCIEQAPPLGNGPTDADLQAEYYRKNPGTFTLPTVQPGR